MGQGGVSVRDGKGAGALCTAGATALATAAHTSFSLRASFTALNVDGLSRVELWGGVIIMEIIQNNYVLKGSATMNKEFSSEHLPLATLLLFQEHFARNFSCPSSSW